MQLQSCSAFRLGRQKGAAPCTASEACSIAWSGECAGSVMRRVGFSVSLGTKDGFAPTVTNGASFRLVDASTRFLTSCAYSRAVHR
eukprot:7694138-Lingulodinium_polyedra.AAC.1